MKEQTYQPAPIDTSDVVLPAELETLGRKLASQVHDVWAVGRMKEGWRYGEERNDAQKTTPCLVPFEDLPASEQAYDLNTAFATLRLLVKLGYRILPPEQQ